MSSDPAVEPTPSPTPAPPAAPRPPPPLFSWGFLGVCILVFLPHATSEPNERLVLYGPAVAAGEWWRVLTANVEHVSAFHIFANGLSIFSFGPIVERAIGSARLFLASVIAGLTSSAAAMAFMWAYPSVGASGVIAGWIGLALPIFHGRARKVLWQWTLLLVLISLVPHVSWAAHLGGFVGGAALGLLIRGTLRRYPTEPFRYFDRLGLPLLLAAAGAVYLVVRFHAGTGST